MKTRIAVLGTGRMGAALASAFLEQGHPVAVWNRTASRAAPLAARGARVAASVDDAVAAAEVVVGNVKDYAATSEILRTPSVQRALRGKVLVELASGAPRQARETAAWAEAHGVRYLDGAIMSVPAFVGKPECTLIYSGPEALYRELEPTLRALGGNTSWLGAPIGQANALDNALLVTLWGALHGVVQGAAVLEAERVPLASYRAGLEGFLPLVIPSLLEGVDRIERRHWSADETSAATVAICHASVRHVAELSEEHGIDLALPRALDQVFRAASERGHAEDDIAALYRGVVR
jgi:3-hydroxyisobutyrate dehydrogenase-like beta-hydroxyacid dehydrogenase